VAVVVPVLREVLAMGLTWRDLVSSIAVLLMVLAYASFVSAPSLGLLSSAWAASAVELVLGSICAVSAASDLHARPQPRQGVIFRKITTVLGTIAVLAGLAEVDESAADVTTVLPGVPPMEQAEATSATARASSRRCPCLRTAR